MSSKVRINRYLAQAGFGSRRKCEELIRRGAVSINGNQVETLSATVDPDRDVVSVHGEPVAGFEKPVILVLNKPAGVISAVTDSFNRKTVIEIAREKGYRERIFPVGRLDFDTTGILLLTNDGEMANRLTHPRYKIDKTYLVTVEGDVPERTAVCIAGGIRREDFTTQPCRVEIVKRAKNSTDLVVTLKEGKKRQVKKMFDLFGHRVVRLHRSAIGGMTFGDLAEGDVRPLRPGEERKLRTLLGLS
ncbi:MAG TPA: pseudouridine synthase [Patescibacteria group bacterium]|nr:pseudouridine synthase [Patescibacteria group bacterium]